MCFSAQASFVAAAGLALLYSYTIRQAKTTAHRFLAHTQLLFALQQACEGVVWATVGRGDTYSLLHQLSVYGYLLFAFGLWPIWIPFVLSLGEPTVARKVRMRFILALGSFVALGLISATFFYGVTASAYTGHILYEIPAPWLLSFIGIIFYISTTLVPLFVSRMPGMHIVALASALGFAVSLTAYRLFFVSIWCFFAAVTSAIITLLIQQTPVQK